MRVHPNLLKPRFRHWRGPVLAASCVLVLLGALALAPWPFRAFSSAPESFDLSNPSLDGAAASLSIMELISSRTVPLAMVFPEPAPRPGARIAVMQRQADLSSVLLVSDAWVAQSDGSDVVLRLSEPEAAILRNAAGNGSITYVEIPPSGKSPFAH